MFVSGSVQALFFLVIDMSQSEECQHESNALEELEQRRAADMAKLIELLKPSQRWYASRKAARNAICSAFVRIEGHSCGVDGNHSNGQRMVVRCVDAFRGGIWKGDLLPDFECAQKEGESDHAFNCRKRKERDEFARNNADICNFKAIVLKVKRGKDTVWCVQCLVMSCECI